jgi:hypothetical protein
VRFVFLYDESNKRIELYVSSVRALQLHIDSALKNKVSRIVAMESPPRLVYQRYPQEMIF